MKLIKIFTIIIAAIGITNVYANSRFESMKNSRTQIFPKYTCKHVEKKLDYTGSNSLTGLVLLPEESENPEIEPFFKKIEFSPFYDKAMGLYRHKRGEIPIRSLTETEDSIVFYSKMQDWRSPKRRGDKVIFTKLGNDRFNVKIYFQADYVANFETMEWESKWTRSYKMDNIGSTSFIYKITEESKKSRESAKCQE